LTFQDSLNIYFYACIRPFLALGYFKATNSRYKKGGNSLCYSFYQIIIEMKFTYLLAAVIVLVGVQAQDHWICTCFRPSYDRGCCGVVNGNMMVDGNVCDIPGRNPTDSQNFRECCNSINGTTKCK
jgi:hypothetical protein